MSHARVTQERAFVPRRLGILLPTDDADFDGIYRCYPGRSRVIF